MVVAWETLEPGQVEAVVALMVNRERDTSTRISPSRGDGGVDILDRNGGPDHSDVVYQVKRYTRPLKAREKNEIRASLDTVLADNRWQDLRLTEWRLVTPLDPTPELETWFQSLGPTNVRKIWHGLTWVNQMAAKYPDIIDYYLNGGRDRIEQAWESVTALHGIDSGEARLDVAQLEVRVRKAASLLERDPLYRYELSVGEGLPPEPRSRPNLVLTRYLYEIHGHWSTIDVIARCAESTVLRPISLSGELILEPGSVFEEQLADFALYGAPFTSPPGAFVGHIDAPGGLSGPLVDGVLTVSVGEFNAGPDPDLHLEVIDPQGNALAAVDVVRVERSRGEVGGLRWVLEESSGLFRWEDRLNPSSGVGSRRLSFDLPEGRPVREALRVLEFLVALRRPNSLRVSKKHTPPELGQLDPGVEVGWSDEQLAALGTMARIVGLLVRLQQHTSQVIRTPDLCSIKDQIPTWEVALKVLAGEEVVSRYPEGHRVFFEPNEAVHLPEGCTAWITQPLTVEVGDQVLELGTLDVALPGLMMVSQYESNGQLLYEVETKDRLIRSRLASFGSEAVRPDGP